MKTLKRYSPVELERAVRLVFEQQHQHSSQWTVIESIASKIGSTTETLRRWVRQSETDMSRQKKRGIYLIGAILSMNRSVPVSLLAPVSLII